MIASSVCSKRTWNASRKALEGARAASSSKRRSRTFEKEKRVKKGKAPLNKPLKKLENKGGRPQLPPSGDLKKDLKRERDRRRVALIRAKKKSEKDNKK
jgi:hypothetical protein